MKYLPVGSRTDSIVIKFLIVINVGYIPVKISRHMTAVKKRQQHNQKEVRKIP
jgi:hypothetical protein